MKNDQSRADILKKSLSKLPLEDVDSRLRLFHRKISRELRGKNLVLRFHLYVSEEWFVADGVPGVAVPFYIFNPLLMSLEKENIGEVEGKNFYDQMRFLRHEMGHCIDNAFGLRSHKERQKLFGDSRSVYPTSYSCRPYSRSFVRYLGGGYAQSHPDEDFAETFAVWLDPSSQWRRRYQGTPAFEKLEFMDRLMKDLRGQRQKLTNTFRVDPIEKLHQTLETYYLEKQTRLRLHHKKGLDRDLRKFFQPPHSGERETTLVHSYLRQERGPLSLSLSQKMGAYRYESKQVIDQTIQRAQFLGLRGTKDQLAKSVPYLLERNFRYLQKKEMLKYYL